MTYLEPLSQLELAQASGIIDARGFALTHPGVRADTLITIHLGPDQTPQVARIWRKDWPTVTVLNYSQDREFHVRLRHHKPTNICLVYASVAINPRNRHQRTIFGDVIQRGRLCKTPAQIHAAIEVIKRELGIPTAPSKPGRLET